MKKTAGTPVLGSKALKGDLTYLVKENTCVHPLPWLLWLLFRETHSSPLLSFGPKHPTEIHMLTASLPGCDSIGDSGTFRKQVTVEESVAKPLKGILGNLSSSLLSSSVLFCLPSSLLLYFLSILSLLPTPSSPL